jgi:hypothetical protein
MIDSIACCMLRPGDYRPPCLQTIQTFGGAAPLPFEHRPKPFLSTPNNPISPIDTSFTCIAAFSEG